MKKILSILGFFILLVWIVTLRDGTVYRGKELSGGRYGVTLTLGDGTKMIFHWTEVQSVASKLD